MDALVLCSKKGCDNALDDANDPTNQCSECRAYLCAFHIMKNTSFSNVDSVKCKNVSICVMCTNKHYTRRARETRSDFERETFAVENSVDKKSVSDMSHSHPRSMRTNIYPIEENSSSFDLIGRTSTLADDPVEAVADVYRSSNDTNRTATAYAAQASVPSYANELAFSAKRIKELEEELYRSRMEVSSSRDVIASLKQNINLLVRQKDEQMRSIEQTHCEHVNAEEMVRTLRQRLKESDLLIRQLDTLNERLTQAYLGVHAEYDTFVHTVSRRAAAVQERLRQHSKDGGILGSSSIENETKLEISTSRHAQESQASGDVTTTSSTSTCHDSTCTVSAFGVTVDPVEAREPQISSEQILLQELHDVYSIQGQLKEYYENSSSRDTSKSTSTASTTTTFADNNKETRQYGNDDNDSQRKDTAASTTTAAAVAAGNDNNNNNNNDDDDDDDDDDKNNINNNNNNNNDNHSASKLSSLDIYHDFCQRRCRTARKSQEMETLLRKVEQHLATNIYTQHQLQVDYDALYLRETRHTKELECRQIQIKELQEKCDQLEQQVHSTGVQTVALNTQLTNVQDEFSIQGKMLRELQLQLIQAEEDGSHREKRMVEMSEENYIVRNELTQKIQHLELQTQRLEKLRKQADVAKVASESATERLQQKVNSLRTKRDANNIRVQEIVGKLQTKIKDQLDAIKTHTVKLSEYQRRNLRLEERLEVDTAMHLHRIGALQATVDKLLHARDNCTQCNPRVANFWIARKY